MLVAIWAEDDHHLIGKDNFLPWRLPEDLKRFKMLTQGNTVVMGRKTFEGMGSRPLPNRKTIILTRDPDYKVEHEDVTVMHNVREVLRYAEKVKDRETVYIAGGTQIFKAFEPYVTKLMRTVVHGDFEGDAYFPDFDYSAFKLLKKRPGLKDEKNIYDYDFETWVKLSNDKDSQSAKSKKVRRRR